MKRRPEVLEEVGGSVDEVSLTLAIHGAALDPDAVSARLGCAPTHVDAGAWFLAVQGSPPTLADDLVALLLGRLPSDEAFWATLRRDYHLQLRCAISMTRWNRGIELLPASLRLIRTTGAPLLFDLHALGDG